jgi:hypothetical protein
VWLAFSLLEQILKNNSGEVPSNRSIFFIQNPTMTQLEKIGGKHGQEPQHNPAFLLSHPRGGARRRGEPSIDFGVFCFIVNKGVAT